MDPLSPAVFAHQGGWDELLFVLAPIALFGFLLWRANRKAEALDAAAADRDPAPPAEAD